MAAKAKRSEVLNASSQRRGSTNHFQSKAFRTWRLHVLASCASIHFLCKPCSASALEVKSSLLQKPPMFEATLRASTCFDCLRLLYLARYLTPSCDSRNIVVTNWGRRFTADEGSNLGELQGTPSGLQERRLSSVCSDVFTNTATCFPRKHCFSIRVGELDLGADMSMFKCEDCCRLKQTCKELEQAHAECQEPCTVEFV